MYLIFCFILFTFVYFLPALALFPEIVFSARTAFAIPILSTLLVYGLGSGLIAFGAFNATAVSFCVLFLGIIACCRFKRALSSHSFHWSSQQKLLYGLHLIVFIPYFVKMGTHTFDRGDELYSWNFWAIQHYFHLPLDFSHTGATYPQLFPKLLAFCYHLLGSVDLQLAVKGMLVIFPLAMLIGISMANERLKKTDLGCYAFLLAYVLAGARLTEFFNDGYADPLMTSALIASVVLFWQSQQKTCLTHFTAIKLATLSVLCAVVCAHAKQAGLLWTLFSLPILLIYAYSQSKNTHYLILSLCSLLGGLIWFLGEGATFYQNDGVIFLSQGQRSIVSQFAYAVNKYFIEKPLLFLLFLMAIYSSFHHKILRLMMWVFMLPSLVLWFIFGAYQLRLGQHLIAFSFFVIVASQFVLPQKQQWQKYFYWCWPQRKVLALVGTLFSLSIATFYFTKALWFEGGGLHLFAGGRQSLYRYFEEDSNYIYQTLYSNPNVLLWVPSRYLYGLFYQHTKLTMPDYRRYGQYSKSALIEEFTLKNPDYVFTVGKYVVDGPASQVLSELIQECPLAFERVSTAKNKFGFTTYKIDSVIFLQDPCLKQLRVKEDIAFKG